MKTNIDQNEIILNLLMMNTCVLVVENENGKSVDVLLSDDDHMFSLTPKQTLIEVLEIKSSGKEKTLWTRNEGWDYDAYSARVRMLVNAIDKDVKITDSYIDDFFFEQVPPAKVAEKVFNKDLVKFSFSGFESRKKVVFSVSEPTGKVKEVALHLEKSCYNYASVKLVVGNVDKLVLIRVFADVKTSLKKEPLITGDNSKLKNKSASAAIEGTMAKVELSSEKYELVKEKFLACMVSNKSNSMIIETSSLYNVVSEFLAITNLEADQRLITSSEFIHVTEV